MFDSVERFASPDPPTVRMNTAQCLHSKDRFSSCEACFVICPVHAITPGKPPVLDTEKCRTCLACLSVCPVAAYSADDGMTTLLNSVGQLGKADLELLCAKNKQHNLGLGASSVGIGLHGCLAGIGTGTYLALAVLGIEHVLVRTEECEVCEWGALLPEIEAQVHRAQNFLSACGKPEILTCISDLENGMERPFWSVDNPPISRRDLFQRMLRQGQETIASAIENVKAPSDQHPGSDHLRVLNAAGHLHVLDVNANLPVGVPDFAFLSVTEACTACSACARGCPTGALRFYTSDDKSTYSLQFATRNCIACELCTHVCVPSAIAIDHAPTFAQVFGTTITTLRDGELAKCVRCGALFAKRDDAQLCTLCEYRRMHPFGSMPPPGFKKDVSMVKAEKQ